MRSKTITNRITIMIDDELYKKTRDVQSFLIKETSRNWSYSKTLSEILDIGLKDKKFTDVISNIIEEKKLE